MARFAAYPVYLIIIQVHISRFSSNEIQIEESYETEELLQKTNAKDNVIILRGWNTVLGEDREKGITSKYRLRIINNLGNYLINFCKRRQLHYHNYMVQNPTKKTIYLEIT